MRARDVAFIRKPCTLELTINTASYGVKQIYLPLQVDKREAVQQQLLRRGHPDVAADA